MNGVSYIALETFAARLEDDTEATESFKILTNLVDVAIRTFYNLKTSLIGVTKDFKRTELRAYHESHKVAVARFYKEKKTGIFNIPVPVPNGMISTYPHAISVIDKYLALIKINDTLDEMFAYANDAIGMRDYRELTKRTQEALKKIGRVRKEDVEKDLRTVFVQKAPETVPLGNVFASFSEIKAADDKVLTYEQVFASIPKIHDRIRNLERVIRRSVDVLEKIKNPDRTYVKALYDLIYTCATQIDMFGTIIHTALVIEHNFVLALDASVQKSLEL